MDNRSTNTREECLLDMDKQGQIQRIKDICQVIPYPPSVQKQEELAEEFLEIVDRLGLDLSDPVKTFPSAFNPFFEACQSGNIPILKIFVERGASLNVFDAHGRTPLFLAISARNNDHNVVSSILDLGAKIDLSSEGRSPLLAAYYNVKRETATVLLRRGADVNNVILPSFCFVESVFSLHSNLVMMASGHRFQLTSFLELVALSTEIVMAGLHQRTFYLTARGVLYERFTRGELLTLWKFQHLCMILNFKVEKKSLERTIQEIRDLIGAERDRSQVGWMTERQERLLWIQNFQSNALPLTYLARIALRSHLVNPHVGATAHVNVKIDSLPLPRMCLDFLKMKHCDIRDVHDYMTV
ncbi:uncharacterized protein LOC101852131 [Aplysia californica]|uniref:Uncharacterized protein LOC101852131 n=1 Tax=Aplysia californica TaxID=6500 RepID=A0ABM0K899_APLCA|nr:uncharacterized protein LOC101852131 [Aplysia californica]